MLLMHLFFLFQILTLNNAQMKISKTYFLSILLIICAFDGYSQTRVTLFYDENGKGLDTKKNAFFYRSVTLDQHNNPVDTVDDYYMNGQHMAKGKAIIVDKLDNRKSAWVGKVYKYNERGKLSVIHNYDENGFLDGTQTIFNKDGAKSEIYDYNHGNPSKDYYLAYDKKGMELHYSYLTHLPMRLATSDKVIVPFTERKIIYQDGAPVQFYFIDGLSVAVKISDKQQYGKYYEAFVTIENGSGNQFDFDPSDITASLSLKGNVEEGEVYLYKDYIKKVNRRQAWSTAFTAFAEVAAATSAGYSSSTTNAYGITSSGRLVSAHATTTSYNGAAQYAATQNAANNLNQMTGQQYDIKRSISEGYLKLNTIFPNSRIIGFVNITYDSADKIYLNIPVNGKVYHFEFGNTYD
jgi:hypothetical protein